MNQNLALPIILLGLFLSGCNDSKVEGAKASEKLHAAGEIATEIQRAHKIKGNPYYKLDGDYGQIELFVSDPEFDHQSLATEISQLNKVQSFDGALVVVFRHPEEESVAPTMWIKYDAKTGKRLKK
ncbi:MAG: hypothetical protein AB8D78_14800 [Akkermansiaceae bacterium]